MKITLQTLLLVVSCFCVVFATIHLFLPAEIWVDISWHEEVEEGTEVIIRKPHAEVGDHIECWFLKNDGYLAQIRLPRVKSWSIEDTPYQMMSLETFRTDSELICESWDELEQAQ